MILLDDCQSSASSPSSRLFLKPVHHWQANDSKEVEIALGQIEQARQEGLHVVALLAYELGEIFQGVTLAENSAARSTSVKDTRTHLIEAFAFSGCRQMSSEETAEWIAQELVALKAEGQTAGVMNLQPSLSEAQYTSDIHAIQRYITQGDTYQVNHTFRLNGRLYGHPLAVYQMLRVRQPVRYGAYIETGQRTILSFSPELFIQNQGGLVTAKPMKGTLGMAQGTAMDLSESEKDCAENLMITDLIRNDLGRICETGSIKVPKLFEVEQVGSVHQMTSTITGRLQPDLSVADLLKATFPCGSVTGAPKKRTMEIIRELEGSPRNLYCGSIVHFEPSGDFRMNVVIRTLEVQNDGAFQMGIGSGITIDSDAKQEWQECKAKAQFITTLSPSVGLIETMRLEAGRVVHLDQHLQRLSKSAKTFGIPIDRDSIELQIQQYLAEKTPAARVASSTRKEIEGGNNSISMLRLELSPSGEPQITHKAITPVFDVQRIFWATDILGEEAVMNSADPMLAHKTTRRALYDRGWKTAESLGGFDALFVNERGEVTEGGRTSLFAKINGEWLTPPLHCGVLPGLMRAELLADPAWGARQAVLTPADVKAAERIVVVNALRGVIKARLVV